MIGTPAKAPKLKALASNPKVSLTIDNDVFPYNVLLVRGTARLEPVEGVVPEYATAVERYLGLDINATVNLDRLYEIGLDKQRQRDAMSGFQLAELIAEHFRDHEVVCVALGDTAAWSTSGACCWHVPVRLSEAAVPKPSSR